jgi:hypothetical protein
MRIGECAGLSFDCLHNMGSDRWVIDVPLVNLVATGMSTDDITGECPRLESEDIRQALQYASVLANEEVTLFKSPAA